AAAGLTTVKFALTNIGETMLANTGSTPQAATAGTAFGKALAVTVKLGSTAVTGVSVTFTAPASGASGTFSNNTATITVATNASGIASAVFTANSTPGTAYTVTASASGLTSAGFSLSNAGAPAVVTANPGSTPQKSDGYSFPNPLSVTVKDKFGNPVFGVSVQFTAPLPPSPSGSFNYSV